MSAENRRYGGRGRSFSRSAQTGSPHIAFEGLEDRRMLAAAWADGEILVQFAASASAATRAQARSAVQGRAIEAIQTKAMGQNAAGVLERVAIGRGLGVAQAIQRLANRPGVVFAEPNWKLAASATSNDPYYTTSGRLWGMYGDDAGTASGPAGTTNQFGSQAEKAWDAGFTGSKSVVIGIVDLVVWLSRKCVGASVGCARLVRDHEVEAGEVECPSCLTSSEMLHFAPVLQVLVVRLYLKLPWETLQVVSPCGQRTDDCQHLLVVDLVVAFGVGHQFRVVGNRVPLSIVLSLH